MSRLFLADSFRKSFGRKTVLKAATVWADPGRISVLFGRNGSGKSTLIRCAMGITAAEQGTVHFADRAYPRPRLSALANGGLFYLPDRGLLSRRMRVEAQLRLVASTFGVAWSDALAIAERLEIVERLSQYPGQLSGGEVRRAELAVVLVRRPACLIADEPLAEIEPRDRDVVAAGLQELAGEGTAVLATGHEAHDLLALADEVIWMTAGTTHGLGSAGDAVANHQFRQEYLGPNFRA